MIDAYDERGVLCCKFHHVMVIVVVIGANVSEVKLGFELGGLASETTFAMVVVAVAVIINAAGVAIAAVVVGAHQEKAT